MVASVDVLVVTASREEFEAARTAADGVAHWRERDGFDAPYLVGALGGGLTVALARLTRTGGRSTGPVVTALTEKLSPTCLAMSGICAGSPDHTAPGDVVVAAPAYEYDEGEQSGPTFLGDHEQYPQDERWLRVVQDFDPRALPGYGEASEREARVWFLERLHRGQNPRLHPARARYFPRGTWQPRLQRMEADHLVVWRSGQWSLTPAGGEAIERTLYDDVDGPEKLPFAVRAGPMASGSAVVEDPGVWERLRTMGSRRILGLDLEAATLATVAHSRRVPHWLVAKGVVDSGAGDRFRGFAARVSAEVLFALLAHLLTPRREARPEPTVRTGRPGAVKLEIVHRLHYDWQDLADLFGVPHFARLRFEPGNEPRQLWEWLEARGRLGELAGALEEIGRTDLADLLR